MLRLRRGGTAAGLILGLGQAIRSDAQDVPDPLPPLPPSMTTTAPPVVVPTPPLVLPARVVSAVPPGGPSPSWRPPALDPISVQNAHPPKFVRAKSRSWLWRRDQGKVLGYPEDFRPRPLGASVYDTARTMVANGEAARLTLYRYDFVPGTETLSPAGLDQLARLAPQFAASPYPLIVERTPGDPALAEARRLAVLAALEANVGPVPPDRVLVGEARAHGMAGINAQILGANAIDRARGYGPTIPILSNGVNSPSGVTGGGGSGQ